MAKKEIEFRDYVTPYDWSYNHDDGLWYEDGKELMPLPKAHPEEPIDFSITYFNGMICDTDTFSGEIEIEDSVEEITEEQNEYMEYLFDKNNFGDSFTFTLAFKTNTRTVYFPSNYNGEVEFHLYNFLDQIKTNQTNVSITYLEEYSDNKLYVYPQENNKIRLIIQNYTSDAVNGPWKILMDVIIDKNKFIKSYENAIKKASNTLASTIIEYTKKHNIPFEKTKEVLKKHHIKHLEIFD